MPITSNVVTKVMNGTNNLFAISLDKKEEDLEVLLPDNWWRSTYSYSFFSNESANILTLLKLKDDSKNGFDKAKGNFPKTPNWSIEKGDYRIKNIDYNKKDFLYYRDLKAKIFKYSLYPVLFFTFVLAYFLSSILTNY